MTDRTTKVTLTAQVNGYISGMEKAAAATRKTNSEAQRLTQQKAAFGTLGKALLAVGTVAAIGVGLAIKSFAEFDAKMSQVKTLSHATTAEMSQLSQAALTMGQNIGFSATQVADAEIELVKAGISLKDIMGGALQGSLQLAAAGQIEVGKATEIATIALTQFGLKGKDIPHVADLLAAGADKALGGVADLGEALKSGGLVAAQFGVSLDETVGTLSAFANAGLIGESAGTDLRQMLLKLADPSAQAKDQMKALGISLYDASGRFVGITNLAGQLHDKLGDVAIQSGKVTEAQRNQTLATLFGARAIAGANVLVKEGAKGIADWTKKVNDQGFAAQQAAGKMDNLQGDIKKLGAAFESDLIRTGAAANGPLRDITKSLTGLAKLFGDLPQPVQQTVAAITLTTAAVGLAGGAFLLGVPKVLAFAGALESVGASGAATALRGVTGFLAGPWGIALTAGAAVLGGVFLKAQADAAAKVQELTDSLDRQTGSFTKATRASTVKSLQDSGTFKAGNRVGVSSEDITSAVLGDSGALARVTEQLDKAKKKAEEFRDAFKGDARGFNTTDAGKNLLAIQGITEAMGAQSAASKQAVLDDIEAAKANGVLTDANKALGDATGKATAALASNGATLDATTTAGRSNQEALDAVANSEQGVIDATQKTSQTQLVVTQQWMASRAELYRMAGQFGLTGAAADNYVNQHLGKIPPVVNTNVNVETDLAAVKLSNLSAMLNTLDRPRTIRINTITTGATALASRVSANGNMFVGGAAQAFADGGIGPGIYSGGAPLYKFAEPETRWEAFISGKPGEEARNRMIWQDAGQRLGMGVGAQAAPQINVTVQSKGGVDLLKYVDVRVDQIDQAKARKFKQG